MKKLLTIAVLTIISTTAVLAQNTQAGQQEILKIHAALDQAYLKGDVAYFESVLADDYVYSDPYGRMLNRAQNLEQFRQEATGASYKVLAADSDEVKVKVSGDIAIVTGNWSVTTVSKSDSSAEPHKDKGRYTGVYERRGGKWMLIAEHFSEAPHDRKLMEQQVLKKGLEYTQMIKIQDSTAVERLLADDYLYTNEKGAVRNKTDDLARYKTHPVKFEIFEVTDQKVRVIGNGAAVETGTVRFKGTDKDGKSFDGSERYTSTWVWRGGRWQLVADHTSEIKQ
jgi:ketosteroid isomerase-like protein